MICADSSITKASCQPFGPIKSSIQSTVEDHKGYNGLTKRKPTRNRPTMTKTLDVYDKLNAQSVYFGIQQSQTPLRQHLSEAGTPWRIQQAHNSYRQVLSKQGTVLVLPQQLQGQSTGVLRAANAPPPSNPRAAGLPRNRPEQESGSLQSLNCTEGSDDATTSHLSYRSTSPRPRQSPPSRMEPPMLHHHDFRPVILLQIGYSKGSPFLRDTAMICNVMESQALRKNNP